MIGRARATARMHALGWFANRNLTIQAVARRPKLDLTASVDAGLQLESRKPAGANLRLGPGGRQKQAKARFRGSEREKEPERPTPRSEPNSASARASDASVHLRCGSAHGVKRERASKQWQPHAPRHSAISSRPLLLLRLMHVCRPATLDPSPSTIWLAIGHDEDYF